jgi:hypothetical protein
MKVGPLIYVARAFNKDIDTVVKWLILVFVGVFDPLAICLVIATSEALKLNSQGLLSGTIFTRTTAAAAPPVAVAHVPTATPPTSPAPIMTPRAPAQVAPAPPAATNSDKAAKAEPVEDAESVKMRFVDDSESKAS